MAQGPTLIQFLGPNLPNLKNIDSIIQLLTSKLCILLSTRRLPNGRRIFVLLFRYLYGSRLIYECKSLERRRFDQQIKEKLKEKEEAEEKNTGRGREGPQEATEEVGD